MYEYFRGKLVEISSQTIVLDVNGIGYKLFLPVSHFGKLPQKESELIVYTAFVVRELSQTIYAFLNRQDRDCFELLINVSGIGPKTALAIIGHLTISDLENAIRSNNLILLSKVPGVGKKTAERLVVELKDKLTGINLYEVQQEPIKNGQILKDALNAMINLGFQQSAALQSVKKAIASLPEDAELSQVIATALRM